MNNPGLRPDQLVREMVSEIGARPSGSDSEQQAMQWIAEKLKHKYACWVESFPFASQPGFFPYYSIVAILLVVSALLLRNFAWLGLIGPGLVALLPDLHEWVTQRLPARNRSHNLWVLPPGLEYHQLNLLFVAHVDTAPVLPSGYAAVLFDPLRRQIFPVMQRTTLILALFSLAALFGIQLSQGMVAVMITVSVIVALALIALDVWDQWAARSQFSSGANDNASGLGVLMALAEKLEPDTFQHLKVGFLFSGAEEAGLWGARHAARKLSQAGCRPAVICVDMVGTGERLRILTGKKSLRNIRTDAEINGWLERSDPLAVKHQALRRSSDFEAFWEVGFPTGWIEASGTLKSWRAYHTKRDQLDGIDQEALGRAYNLLIRLVNTLERVKYLPGSR